MGSKRKKKRGKTKARGGSTMSGLRSGLKGMVGQGKRGKKEPLTSKLLTYLLLAAAVGMLIYRFAR